MYNCNNMGKRNQNGIIVIIMLGFNFIKKRGNKYVLSAELYCSYIL